MENPVPSHPASHKAASPLGSFFSSLFSGGSKNRHIFMVESRTENIKHVRDQIEFFMTGKGFSAKQLNDILVAVGEGFTNCIRHSYGSSENQRIKVTLEDHAEKVVFKIRDYGKKIDLKKVKKPTLPPEKPGGLGIYFMQTLVDEMRYNTRVLRGTELILIKYKNSQKKDTANENSSKS